MLIEKVVPDGCLAVKGAFDGVHCGHRAALCALASPRTVVTWMPTGPVLSTRGEKEFLLARCGVDVAVFLPEAPAAAEKDPLGERIRAYFAAGDFAAAAELLGGGYVIQGAVVRGKGVGHRHGMPTANLALGPEKILPPEGVYGVCVWIGNERYYGLTNVGRRPSDDDMPHISVETLISDFSGDLYGQILTLELRCWLRSIRRFSGGLDELRLQLLQDEAEMRRRLQGAK